jgi:hypothetical protein
VGEVLACQKLLRVTFDPYAHQTTSLSLWTSDDLTIGGAPSRARVFPVA